MCWLNSVCRLTKDKAEGILSAKGSRYVPSGVVMRHQDTGEAVIVELASARWLSLSEMDAIMHPSRTPKPRVS